MTVERRRLGAVRRRGVPWKRWGPYLSERQWGTVREHDRLDSGAWTSFPHDHARSRAYRWGEDGIAGIGDDQLQLCFAVALWNGNDPILKERLFGLTNGEGNHGEDVKEYYYYLDSTPTHSWMEYLYKYPQAAFPYDDLVDTNARRGLHDYEYELIDTGVFDDDRYFDVYVRYAKESPEDVLVEITAINRGPEPAPLSLLPTLWFRNTWGDEPVERPSIERRASSGPWVTLAAEHDGLGPRYLYGDGDPEVLATENETNRERLFGEENPSPYVKDGINDAVVDGAVDRVDPSGTGTKVALRYEATIDAGASHTVRLRLTDTGPDELEGTYPSATPFGRRFPSVMRKRKAEADQFYDDLTPDAVSADEAAVMRQALAGMLWTKQFYHFDVTRWFADKGLIGREEIRRSGAKNAEWHHMVNADIISMPDTWEYPWYAAWDLAFHTIPLAVVDLDFAKHQLALMLEGRYIHPNGQIPAYEWNFSDVNPPVHAWATMRVYEIEKERRGTPDVRFLEESFHKLAINYTWWVNQKDTDGNDLFGGGFLGLDNIGVFDRSSPLPTGGHIEQADGTAWMAFFALSMLEITIELALHDPSYQRMAAKFFEHFLWIAEAMNHTGDDEEQLWDEEDGFFYDVIVLPDGRKHRMKVRSLVGLLPLAACIVLDPDRVQQLPELMDRVMWLNEHRPHLVANIPTLSEPGVANRRLLAPLSEDKLLRLIRAMLDESEFLSDYGIRSVSRRHLDDPFVVDVGAATYRVDYLPAESDSGMFGGNSNWRGPVWFPINFLLLRGLFGYDLYYGDDLMIEYPTGSGNEVCLHDAAVEVSRRLTSIFLLDEKGRRPVFGGNDHLQGDPLWRDNILFYEYFHGDNGAGLGASHQTGWTGLVARLIQLRGLGGMRPNA